MKKVVTHVSVIQEKKKKEKVSESVSQYVKKRNIEKETDNPMRRNETNPEYPFSSSIML